MSLLRWKDFDELMSIKDEVNRMLDKMFESTTFHSIEERYSLMASGVPAPQFKSFYRGEDFVIQSQMTEYEKGDIKLSVTENLLAIGSEVRREREFAGNDAYRYQRSHGSFCKVMELPSGLNTSGIKSTFVNGVLEVIIPKAGRTVNVVEEKATTVKAIPVQSAESKPVRIEPSSVNTLPAKVNEK